MSLPHIILAAHGSRRTESNQEVRRLAEQLGAGLGGGQVRAAFLEFEKPTIADALHACGREGAESVMVVPYFLAAGRHVTHDLPAVITETMQKHPQVKVRLLPHLGAFTDLSQLLLGGLFTALGTPQTRQFALR